jgi:ABC-2 type transport system permease protein
MGGLTILGLMYLAMVAGLLLLHANPVDMTVQVAFMAGAGVVLPALFFMGLGGVVSQLAGNGRRATTYGLVPLFVLFTLRSVGNVVASNDWLKTLTPFGWIDKWRIVDNPHAIWAFVSALAAVPLVALAIYLAGKRDLGDSIIAESDISKPHYTLLGGVGAFSLRRMRTGLVAWWLSALAMTIMIAGLAKDAANAVNDSEALRKSLSSLAGGSHSIEPSFVGVSALFLGITLLAMMVNGVGSTRREEAKNYADTLLVNPVGRYRWLFGRWIILIAAAAFIITTSGIATWAIVRSQHIAISFWTEVGGLLSIMGPLLFTLGIGVLLYGFKPRLAVPIAYAYLVWSFAIDLVGSTVALNDIVQKSSIFHYISLVPAESPDWKASWILLALGTVLVIAGSYLFNHRDLETE